MDADTEMVILQDTSMHETLTQELSVVAAQFVEAACRARDGDREATTAHIAHAMALLRGIPSLSPSGTRRLSDVEAQVVRGGLPAWQMRRVIAHVEANLSRRISVEELARLLCLSASHFCRAFKCTFGYSPHAFLMRRRMERAQGLMLKTNAPLAQIALDCGFADQAHLSRRFLQFTGECPSSWRRARASGAGLGP